jgi:transcriptional regulator NrdR family protein
MVKDINIIKHSGKRPSESFSKDKLHASILAACLSVRSPEGEASLVAHNVTNAVIEWLEIHAEVTSNDLRRKAAEILRSFHPDAAYLYQQHRLVI